MHDYSSLDGGAEAGTMTLRRVLLQRGIDARVFAARTGANDIADHLCFGTKGRFRTVLQTANPSAWIELRKVMASWRPDVVHVRMFLTQLSPLILPALRSVPSLYHAVWYRAICPLGTKVLPDGSECRSAPGTCCLKSGCLSPWDWSVLMLQMRMFERWRDVFDAVVANSEAVRRKLEEAGIGPAEVVRNGVPSGPEPAALSDQPTVVFAGRLVREKGAHVLLRAFAKANLGRLLIAGDGPEREALRRLAAELGIEDRVCIAGRLPQGDLEKRFLGAWAQVVPSLWAEPFGFVAPEAMMRGTAVIASHAGGLAEVVEHGRTGLLVASGDIEGLAGALTQILGDRDLAARMGAAGRERAILHYHESLWADRFVRIYERLIRSRQEHAE